MSERLLRLVGTAAVAAQAALAPVPAVAAPKPQRFVTELLTDLQMLYRQAEQSTETYNATAVQLTRQRAVVKRLDRELARARLSLHDSRQDAARLARQQYQASTGLSPYVRLLLSRNPQRAVDEGHVIGQLSRVRADTVDRLEGSEKKQDALAHKARKALDGQVLLAERQQRQRDVVRTRLADIEKLLDSLSAAQLAALARFEQKGIADAQREFVASGSLSSARPPSQQGSLAVRYAMEQLGKPYQWGAQGPGAYDCSGLTSQAWQHAGTPIPRTSQEQWARLPRVPLNELRPGDLVVYFPEATHVAMYLGDGKVVQAPRPGDQVKISPIAANPILGAVRPDPNPQPLGARGTARPPTDTPAPPPSPSTPTP
ncbi:NlpC/P60 family protein [Streptomyces shenzhenensis]|uniref:C40 family peptidase n=1 Tax=Streptomyces shenzhenensis TaxID=943815 RepID=UPI0036AB9F9E